VAHVTTGLSIEAGAAWNHSELVKEADIPVGDGTPIDFGTLQTARGRKVSNPGGVLGSPLAGAPPFRAASARGMTFAFNAYNAFAQIGAAHQSHSLATTDQLRLDLQGKSIAYDHLRSQHVMRALGVGKNAWLVQVYAENLTDTRAELYGNYAQWYKAITVSRPRTIGLRFSYKSGSS